MFERRVKIGELREGLVEIFAAYRDGASDRSTKLI